LKDTVNSKGRKVVAMEDHGFHNDGWYSHDGEGKDMCTGPGCDCDEKNYGYHSSASNGNISTFGAILCVVGGLIGTALVFCLFGIDAENVPGIVIIILWVVITSVLVAIGGKHGL
jgi:hypothetical protein